MPGWDQRPASGGEREGGRRVTRRGALVSFGGLLLAATVTGCADTAPSAEGGAGGATTATDGGPTCVLSPEQTEGPFYIDLARVRSDITEGRPGVPLRLRTTVVDVDRCAPLRDAAVDVWHADAGGAYSGVGQGAGATDGLTFLRGTQVTDRNGVAEFRTIYPGWYPGRTVHFHVKVLTGGSEAFTGQLYFDDALTDLVFQRVPYSSRRSRSTRNADDGLFAATSGATLVATAASGEGYAGAVTLGVRRA